MLDKTILPDNELTAWDRDHFFHPSTHMGQHARGESPNRIIAGGEGVHIVDRQGRRSLDAFAGLYCVNVGYGREKIAEAIAEQAAKLPYYHAYVGHGSEPSIRLAKMIIDRAPQGMSRVFFGLSGSDANETNVKLVWYYNNVLGRPKKKKIISRWRGYHGSGLMTGSLTGLAAFHNQFDLPLPPVLHTEAPYYFRRPDRSMDEDQFSAWCAEKLEELILAEGPETVAAFIGEPVLGTGGIVPPPRGYWEKIQAVLAKYDVLLIADEVVTGFGRLGSMFGSDHYGIRPDLITIAKGLTSAYAPLSGVIVSEKVWRVLEEGSDKFGPIGHGWTYSAHPLCAAAGVANLELVDELGLVAKCGGGRRLFPEGPQGGARRPSPCRRGARRGAARGRRVREGQGRSRLLRRCREGRPARRSGASRARRHRPRHAARRHPRLRAAAVPDARGGGCGRRRGEGGGRGRAAAVKR